MLLPVADTTQPKGMKNGAITLQALLEALNSDGGVDISQALVTPVGSTTPITLAALAAAVLALQSPGSVNSFAIGQSPIGGNNPIG
jgi:hypothetical protein